MDKISYKISRDKGQKYKKLAGPGLKGTPNISEIFQPNISYNNSMKQDQLKQQTMQIIPIRNTKDNLLQRNSKEEVAQPVEFFSNCWNKYLDVLMTAQTREGISADVSPEQGILEIIDKQIESNQRLFEAINSADDETFQKFVQVMTQETDHLRRLREETPQSNNPEILEQKRNSLFHDESQRDIFEKLPFPNFLSPTNGFEETRSLGIGLIENRPLKINSKKQKSLFQTKIERAASDNHENSSIYKRNPFDIDEEINFTKICEFKKKIVKKSHRGHYGRNLLQNSPQGETGKRFSTTP